MSEFAGTDRFRIIRRLGEGGMGVVYLAHDQLRGADVALKTLRRDSPYGIIKLKSEFRSLAEVAHPNLVDLHDLHHDGGTWFFTMEYVEGESLDRFVRPQVGFDGGPTLDVERLRHAMRQLVEGIAALHDAGHLHRDIKPSNVLVERNTRRLVVLDFGLVTPLHDRRQAPEPGFSGTLEYMAPEQADGGDPLPAADWYSVGVVLFEALTGQLPFRGKPFKIMIDKRRKDAPDPSSVAPDVPDDLDRLCRTLLNRDPAARPDADAILEALGSARMGSGPMVLPRIDQRRLIGREAQTAALEDALAAARAGRSTLVTVHGGSGMGKSALLRRFLDPLIEQPDLLVLSGRCYERESVPYKAFDTIIDALAQRLGRMPDEELEAFMPPALGPLTRLFPVLLHVDPIAIRSLPEDEPSDPRELRQRGFSLLRQLFAGLARRMVPVLHIDDLQWGDRDSAVLLTELLRGDDPPPMLVLGSYRSEEVESSTFLRSMLDFLEQPGHALEWQGLQIGPLDAADAARLARSRLGEREGAERLSALIARESGGNPYFVEALARHLRQTARLVEGGLTVEEVVRQRIDGLETVAQRLMHALAVHGRPLDQRIAFDAAGVPNDAIARTVGLLRAEHLLRVRASGHDAAHDALELYHDRIREAVTGGLPEISRRSVHMELGLALERRDAGDPEELAEHFIGAGDLDRSRRYTAESAERAVAKLAFDRAAELFSRALDLHRRAMASSQGIEADAFEQERRLLESLGRALVDAGRGPEAAAVLLEAAEASEAEDRLELTLEAGTQLLISGKLKHGVEVTREVLGQIGMSLPGSARRALPGLLGRRARMRLRGLDYAETDADALDRRTLTRIDACWSVGLGLGLVDHVRAADFQTRSLLLALDAGEPMRVARAMAMEGAYASATGPGGQARAEMLVDRARAIAERIDVPYALGMTHYGTGVAHFLAGQWRPAVEHLVSSAEVWRDRCRGVNWETTTTFVFQLSALAYLGDVDRIASQVPELLAQARDRGNVYFSTNLRTGYPSLAWLVLDDPETGAAHHAEAMQEWGDDGFHVQHYFDLIAGVHLDLYRERPADAWQRARSTWKPLRSSLVHHVHLVNLDTVTLRARSALAALAAGIDVDNPRGTLNKDIRTLIRSKVAWAVALGHLFSGQRAMLDGDEEAARAAYTRALEGLEATETALYAAATRLRLGALVDGDEGQALVSTAEAEMITRGVRRPRAMARILAPV